MSASGTRERKKTSSPAPRTIETVVWNARERRRVFTFG
jgi:hypothetical protein